MKKLHYVWLVKLYLCVIGIHLMVPSSCLTILAVTNSDSLHIEGQIKHEILSADERVASSVEMTFNVVVNGCNWLIKTTDKSNLSKYVEIAFENGTLYRIHSFPSSMVRPVSDLSKGAVTSRDSSSALANAETSSITGVIGGKVEHRILPPQDDGSLINYLWLAYASACYLNQQTKLGEETLHPIWTLDDPALENEEFKMRSQWERVKDSPPRYVNFISDGTLYYVDADHKRRSMQLPGLLGNGYTNATFSAHSLTNLAQWTLPLSFTFTRYGIQFAVDGSCSLFTIESRVTG